jgi:predicted porin
MPVRRLTIAASYAKSSSNTATAGIASANQFESKSVLLQYQFRKMYFTAGYAQLQQGFSVSGIAPSNVSSYYFGVSRWFNFF